MSNCSNCFNGCTETTSDQCVKYTGADIEALGISTGDSLAVVESAIAQYLITALNGTGIIPTIDPTVLCTLVNTYLIATTPTLIDVLEAFSASICSLQSQTTDIVNDIAVIEADYTTDCLPTVLPGDGTHAIVQRIIDELCDAIADITALNSALTAYVKIADINTYIAAYISGATSSKYATRMVPYAVTEFYGDLVGKFDATGAGIGDWEDIYLCNGQNSTPDKRGRIPVGATTMGNTPFNSAVDPGIAGNPKYELKTPYGANSVTLSTPQIPVHTHVATTVVTELPHTHSIISSSGGNDRAHWSGDNVTSGILDVATITDTEAIVAKKTNVSVSVGIAVAGGGSSHSNIPPVMGCYYIMYIPS